MNLIHKLTTLATQTRLSLVDIAADGRMNACLCGQSGNIFVT
jgi:hypothetical protein